MGNCAWTSGLYAHTTTNCINTQAKGGLMTKNGILKYILDKFSEQFVIILICSWLGIQMAFGLYENLNEFGESYTQRHPYKFAFGFFLTMVFWVGVIYLILIDFGVI